MRRILFLSILLFINYLYCNASVIINEVMPKNISFHINSNFNFEGWIELYNNGNEDVDISTLFVSDDAKNPFKWQMPYDSTLNVSEYILSPQSYKIIYMDKLDQAFHANFKLEADGGTIYLTTAEGAVSDKFTYKESYRNSSVGRMVANKEEIVLFSNPTPNRENDTTSIITHQCPKPSFLPLPGFYKGSQNIRIFCEDSTAKIYYTTDGSEPQPIDSLLYTDSITLTKNTPIRAIAITKGKHRSDISTGSYFFETRQITLPVISLVSEYDFFYGDSLGFLVVGKNGAPVSSGCNAGIPRANYVQDWDRPCNFEYYDLDKNEQMNQEVRIGGFGGCSRTNKTKSIKIKANKTFGNNRFDYPIFKEKPNLKWKSIVLRNSGNDYSSTMLRDGFLQSALIGRMDIDHQAYEPAAVYINGSYYGMLNIRERTGEDFVFSNYGLDEDSIYIHEGSNKYDNAGNESDYSDMFEYFTNVKDMNADGMYDSICAYVDVEELLNYLTAEIYLCNRDWPRGNIKAWKKKKNGKWRWILYDTDFGFSLYEDNRNTNSYKYARSNQLFDAFLKNDLFRFRLMTKMVVHLPTTFSEKRLNAQLDSVTSIISSELNYFRRQKGAASGYSNGISKIKAFAKVRPKNLFNLTSHGLYYSDSCALNILSDIPMVQYKINHFETADVSNLYSNYFENLPLSVEPIVPPGYKFDHWEVTEREPYYSYAYYWKCYDQGEITDPNWKNIDFDCNNWKNINGRMGFGYENTDSQLNMHESNGEDYITTAYFRYNLQINDTTGFGDITLSTTVNDAAIVYLNGKEIVRANLLDGEIAYDDKSKVYFGASRKTYDITLPASAFRNGKNIIAVEVHNHTKTSNTLYFDMDIQTSQKDIIHKKVCNEKSFYDDHFFGGTLRAFFEKETEDEELNKEGNLYLNEICISNSTFVDEARESNDWIEIYNDGWESVNLAGYFLSDARKNLTKFQIPATDSVATTIPAKGYKVFWADSQPEQGPLHTNFSLPTSRTQTVSLSKIANGDTIVIDSICYKPHLKGESFARFSLNKNENSWEVTSLPTFNKENPAKTDVPTIIVDENSAIVYPNPVRDFLHISMTQERCQIVICDISGRILIEKMVDNKTQLDVTSLKKGMYLLKIHNNSFQYTTKIIKEE
jgi:hypothetical protein